MYERFYQLRERPFALSPDPDPLYPSRVHQETLSYLRYGIESQAGFVVITEPATSRIEVPAPRQPERVAAPQATRFDAVHVVVSQFR